MATSSTLSFKLELGYGLSDTASHFVWDTVGFWILVSMSCAAFLAFYRLDALTCRRMERELEARRAGEPSEVASRNGDGA